MALRIKMPASWNGFQFQLCLGLQHQSSTYPGGGTDGSSDCTLPPAQQTWTVSSPGPLSPNHCRHLGAGDELMHGSSNNNKTNIFQQVWETPGVAFQTIWKDLVANSSKNICNKDQNTSATSPCPQDIA